MASRPLKKPDRVKNKATSGVKNADSCGRGGVPQRAVRRPRQFEHVFRYKNRTVRLICSMETRQNDRHLVLEEVLATTLRTANGVPDWRIEAEACNAAFDRHAKYM